MRLGGEARYYTEVTTKEEIEQAVNWAIEHQVPPLMIGGGSNIIWRDEGFAGLVIVNKVRGYKADKEPGSTSYLVTIGAGENWDDIVERTVASGLTGIEALSLIPGSAGATPVQNVGAYGQEIANVLVSIEAYDLHTRQFVTILPKDCAFGYRTSRFKTVDRDRFLISSITLRLQKQNPAPPFYRALTDYFAANNITEYTPQVIREAVTEIRTSKLPDPAFVSNNGSFFANPVIDNKTAMLLVAKYPKMPHWPDAEGHTKIPAAWLIEEAGFKDFHDPETGMATWPTQPLVLVNEKAKTTADLLKFKQKIVDGVRAKFGLVLEQEPELLP